MTGAAGTGTAPRGQQADAVHPAIILAVVLSAILEVLDSTIVNVALPHIQSAFGATNDQITWVLTSYIVSSVVVMPLTGYMSRKFGRRRLILTSVSGFTLFSAFCGLSWSLESLTFFRLGQGAFGAFLIPLAQSILFDAFPREKRGQAMALFGLGVVVAPVFGPTLGALLTEYFSWRMVFYVNLPIAALALLLLASELPPDHPQDVHTDWTGLALMAISIGALQFVLDQGQMRDWFASHMIQTMAVISAYAGAVFLIRGLRHPHNIVDLGLFEDRNFAMANLAMAGFAVSMFAAIAILPLFVQGLLGYPVLDAGLLFIPRGLAAGASMVITGAVLVHRFDARVLATVGLVLTATGNFMLGQLTLDASFWQLAWPGVVSGFGMGLFFVPMSTLAFESISRERQDEASGLYGVTRQLGSSIGIAVVASQLVRHITVDTGTLAATVSQFDEAARSYLAPLGLSPATPQGAAVIGGVLSRQAAMMAYAQIFTLLGWAAIVLLPLMVLMGRPKSHAGTATMAH